MKKNRYNLYYQDKNNWRRKVKMLKSCNIPHEAEIKEFALKDVSLVVDYNGKPIMKDTDGSKLDLFIKLYKIKYQTKLRILPA